MNIFSDDILKLDFETLKIMFSEAFSEIFSTTSYRFNPTYLYRGRTNWDGKKNVEVELFDNISEMWAPSSA